MSQETGRKNEERGRSRPKYLEIRQQLLQQVHSGAFQPGQSLPKERDLAITMGVAIGTLRQALEGLEREGVIRRVRGKGTFVNSAEERRARTKMSLFSVIVPALDEDPVTDLIAGTERAAAEIEHRVLISNSDNDPHRQAQLLREAVRANVAGVVLVPPTEVGLSEHVEPLREHQIPIVFCNRVIPGVVAPLVTWPHVDVGLLAAETLLKQGHRRITSLADVEDVFVGSVGVGIRQAMRQREIDTSSYQLHCYAERLRGQYAQNAIRRALGEILSADDRPTAIQCFNSFDAEQVYLLAGEMGLQIPRDLSLVYFGSRVRRSALAQRLTCIGADEAEIGVRACALLGEINTGQIPCDSSQKIEIPLELLPGETVGPPCPMP